MARSCQDHTSKKEELTEAITNRDKLIAGRWLHGSISQVNDTGGQGCFLRRPHNRCQLPSTVSKWRQLYTCNSKGRDTESIAQRICKELETSLMTRECNSRESCRQSRCSEQRILRSLLTTVRVPLLLSQSQPNNSTCARAFKSAPTTTNEYICGASAAKLDLLHPVNKQQHPLALRFVFENLNISNKLGTWRRRVGKCFKSSPTLLYSKSQTS